MTVWRLITDDGVSASFGLAADDTMARRVGRGDSPPTLRLYTYRSHCALVGRFQTVENEVHVDYCREHDIAVNRRPTGGGAIIMGADQLGVALTLPGRGETTYGRAREMMARFSEGLVHALRHLGVEARFRRKNDIEVAGRKIVGLGIYRSPSGGLLFHASLLVDLDIPLMLRVLKVPFEKISDKEIATVAQRITTVRREVGRAISLDEVRATVADAYAAVFGVRLVRGDFETDERLDIAALERTRYLSDTWVYQTADVADAVGVARIKTPGGLVEVRVTLAGHTLKAAYIGGDFFAAEQAIADLEARLRWHSADPAALEATVRRVCARWPDSMGTLTSRDLVRAISMAVRRARVVDARRRSDPYGCFVTPGGAHA